MIFTKTKLAGAYVIDPEPMEDDRGFFARTWCEKDAVKFGLNPHVAQCNVSFNKKKGTLRGMHYQVAPHAEAKLVRCTRGSLYDVVVDLRPGSKTFRQWLAIELTVENHRMLYVPEGFAHGFETLTDDTEVYYQMSESFVPDCARAIRWNDAAIGIEWPLPVTVISERDKNYPDLV